MLFKFYFCIFVKNYIVMSLVIYKKDPHTKKVVFASDGMETTSYTVRKHYRKKMLIDEETNTCIGGVGSSYVNTHILANFSNIINNLNTIYRRDLTDQNILINENNICEIFSDYLSNDKFKVEDSDYSFQCLLLINGTDLYYIETYRNLKQVEVTFIKDNYFAIGYGMDFALGALDCNCSVEKAFAVVHDRTISINNNISKFEFYYE